MYFGKRNLTTQNKINKLSLLLAKNNGFCGTGINSCN